MSNTGIGQDNDWKQKNKNPNEAKLQGEKNLGGGYGGKDDVFDKGNLNKGIKNDDRNINDKGSSGKDFKQKETASKNLSDKQDSGKTGVPKRT